jgi:hypothetical protein
MAGRVGLVALVMRGVVASAGARRATLLERGVGATERGVGATERTCGVAVADARLAVSARAGPGVATALASAEDARCADGAWREPVATDAGRAGRGAVSSGDGVGAVAVAGFFVACA